MAKKKAAAEPAPEKEKKTKAAKTEPAKATTHQERLKAVIAEVKANYGLQQRFGDKLASPVVMASDVPSLLRIPTWIMGVDFPSGMIPVKRVTLLVGEESTGKTTTAALIVKAAQRLCYRCFALACDCEDRRPICTGWIDAEKALDADWLRSLGVDTEHVLISTSGFAEGDVDVAAALLDSREIELLVFDSVASLTPMVEIEESVEKHQQGVLGKLMAKAFRKWSSSLNRGGPAEETGVTLIIVNQFRKSLAKYGPTRTLPGGDTQKYVAAVRLDMYRGTSGVETGTKESDAAESDGSGTTGSGMLKWQQIKVVAQKNKTCPAKGVGVFRLWVRDHGDHRKGEIEELTHVMELAIQYGMVEEVRHEKTEKVVGFRWVEKEMTFPTKPQFAAGLDAVPVPGTEDLKGRVTLWDEFRCQLVGTMIGEPVNVRLWHRQAVPDTRRRTASASSAPDPTP